MRKFLRMCEAGALALAFFFLPAMSALAAGDMPQIQASGMVLLDADTTRILASQKAHEKLPMASTTKIMTAILCIEAGDLDRIVDVPDEAYGVEGSSMYLHRGEQISLRDLLYGLMLLSGNDAAVTIAVSIAGSVENFAKLMNEKARQLGCVNTNFVTPNGLPNENHYTTAYDLALIAAYSMKNETFQQMVQTTYYQTQTGDMVRTLKSKNRILWEYPGGNGVKTGYTKAAGRCLVFSARQNEQGVIGVVLNAPNMWEDAKRLLDYAFSTYNMEQKVRQGEIVAQIPVKKGLEDRLEIVAKRSILFPEDPDIPANITMRMDCPIVLEAPVVQGDVIGRLELYCEGRMLAYTDLVAAQAVSKKEYSNYFLELLDRWAS